MVDADVFARKIRAVVTALKRADRVANGKGPLQHSYFISQLATGSAIVSLTEIPKGLYVAQGRPRSSVDTLIACARLLSHGHFDSLKHYEGLPGAIQTIAKGANEQFSHIDLMPQVLGNDDGAVRIDDFFEKQVEEYLTKAAIEPPKRTEFFRGTSYDAFDGLLKEVDLRGSVWRGKFILSGTNNELDCIMIGPSLEDVQKSLNIRVWAEGLAIYGEHSGLPVRLEIARMRSIKTTGDLRRWRGKVSLDDRRGDDEGDWLDQ